MFNSIDYQQSYIVKEKYLNSCRFKQKLRMKDKTGTPVIPEEVIAFIAKFEKSSKLSKEESQTIEKCL